MATGNGYFDESDLEALKTSLDAVSISDAVMRTYGQPGTTAKALMDNQTAQMQFLEDGSEKTVKVLWTEMTEQTIAEDGDVSTTCEPTTVKPGSYSQTYTLDKKFGRPVFEIPHYMFRNDFFGGDAGARVTLMQFIQADFELVKALNAYAYTFLNTNFWGVETLNWDGNGNYTPSASGIGMTIGDGGIYPTDLTGDIDIWAAELNIPNPMLVGGASLHKTKVNANASAGFDPTSKEYVDMLPNWYPDIKTFATVPFESFVVSPTAYAFAVRNYFSDTRASEIPAMREGGMNVVQSDKGLRKHFTIESRFMPGLFFDVTSFTKCVGEKNYSEVFQFTLNAKLFLNPASVNETDGNTGILKLIDANDISS